MIRPLALSVDFDRPNTTWSLERLQTEDETGMLVLATYKIRILYTPVNFDGVETDRSGRTRGTFRLQIKDAADTLLLSSERLRKTDDLLARYKYDKRLPAGRFRVYATYDKDLEPARGIQTQNPVDGRDIDPAARIRVEYIYP